MTNRLASIIESDLPEVPLPARGRVKAFRLIIGLATQLRALMDRRLATSGITTQQAVLLTVASSAKNPLSQGEIAAMLGVSHQNVRQLTDALSKKGLVEVQVDRADRRLKRVVTKRQMKKLFAERNEGDFRAVSEWFSALDERELDTLLSLLERVGRTIEKERATTLRKAAGS